MMSLLTSQIRGKPELTTDEQPDTELAVRLLAACYNASSLLLLLLDPLQLYSISWMQHV